MKRLIQAVLRPFGLRLARIDAAGQPAFGLDVLFAALKRHGFRPAHVIDVGANHGNWTRKAIEYFPDASYTLVEPQDALEREVQDLIDRGCKIRWIRTGAGDTMGTRPFSINSRDDSSFFPGNGYPPADGARLVSVEVRTLNDIVATSGLPVPSMVKIDAEGFDLKVLAGATELLGKTEVFLVEAAVCETQYENSVLAVTQTMAKAGYRLIDITELNRSPRDNALWLCELVFLRTQSPLLDAVTSYD